MTIERSSEEFKAVPAIELAELGKLVSEVAEELGISSNLIYRCWRRGIPRLATGTDEMRKLRGENANLKIERHLKKGPLDSRHESHPEPNDLHRRSDAKAHHSL